MYHWFHQINWIRWIGYFDIRPIGYITKQTSDSCWLRLVLIHQKSSEQVKCFLEIRYLRIKLVTTGAQKARIILFYSAILSTITTLTSKNIKVLMVISPFHVLSFIIKLPCCFLITSKHIDDFWLDVQIFHINGNVICRRQAAVNTCRSTSKNTMSKTLSSFTQVDTTLTMDWKVILIYLSSLVGVALSRGYIYFKPEYQRVGKTHYAF